jgi:oxygen-independent coproporphyrinogen III oxidase
MSVLLRNGCNFLKNPGLYIHVPFCRSKCPYCGFYSIASISLVPRWLESLKQEINLYKGLFGAPFDSLYLGGGTPTVLTPMQLNDIMDHLFTCCQFTEGTEITVEANPGDIDLEKVIALKSMGFNRVNLGVQSFKDDELKFLGRRHSGGDAEKAIESIRAAGFENLGVDFIYGLKGQTLEGWRDNLEKAMAFSPEHISCYELSIEKGTLFSRMKDNGQLALPDQEIEESFFLTTSEFLEGSGYIHYEISNFARGEAFYSRHNRKYWDSSPYLGLGPSAHSFDGASRWWNHGSVRRYCEAIEKMESPVEENEILSGQQAVMESVSLGLRTRWGFDQKLIGNSAELKKNIPMLINSGFIRVEGDMIIPTKKGFLIADRLPLYFLD